MKPILTVLLAAVMTLSSLQAEAARRLGGGRSVGQQSSNVVQREAARPAVAPTTAPAPAQQAAPNAAPRPAPAAPAPVAARKPWGAMLGGLAAGLGLAWLAHSLGMGEAFGNVLMVMLFAFLAMALIGWFMRSRRAGAGQQAGYAYSGAASLPQYNPEKVGNDASARPWEQSDTRFDASPAQGSMIGSALQGSQNWGVPSGFDVQGFVDAAKRNFVTLQDAWDRADYATLHAMMTDTMLTEIQNQIKERDAQFPGQPNKTEVVMLDAQLLGIEELDEGYMASVEFNGMIREEPSAGPSPFREVWNMTKSKDGRSGWLVAGVQALQ